MGPLQARLCGEGTLWRRSSFALSLEAGTCTIRDPSLVELLTSWADPPHRGRLLITCRHRFAVPGAAAPWLGFRHLGPLSRSGAVELARSLPALGLLGGTDLDVVWRLLGGHPRAMDSVSGPAVFYRLDRLRPGDLAYVRRADGTVAAFRVTATALYPKDRFPTAAVYGSAPGAELRLITCGGAFDRAIHSYLSNVVVYAVAVRPGQAGS